MQLQSINPPKYGQAQQARILALHDQFGSTAEQYSKLPSLLEAIQASDPLAFVELKIDHENVFEHLFWSYGAAKTFPKLQRMLFSVYG